MRNSRSPETLVGRRTECEALDDLLAGVRGGRSAAVLVHGEAGIGKTALLEYVRRNATGCGIGRAAGVESEMELAFGGLHQLCAPFLEHADRLPDPQREALGTVFGMTAAPPPDRFLVGLAVLSLLAEAAEERPLVCLVDDAQWLDQVSAQILVFVARRLLAERVALVFAMRDPGAGHALTTLPRLEVAGLSGYDAGVLLDSAARGPLDERIRGRILAEARGNPLALLELPRTLTAAELAGGFGSPDARPLAGRLEEGFLRRVRSLPAETQRVLLIAAAEPGGDVTLVRRAAQRLGLAADDAAAPAEAAGLLTLDTWVRFRHPLVRSAAYRAAPTRDRQAVHRALSEATDARADPDRRAWHLACATPGLDESVAAELERSADQARARGGVAAAAAFLARAAQLTPDPARRGARSLAAAQAKHQAGAFGEALALLDAAELSPLDDLARAQSTLLRGQVVFASRSASAGLPVLLDAAKQFEPLDAGLARETYRDAIYAALTAGRMPGDEAIEKVARATLTMAPALDATRTGLLLEGLARMTVDGYPIGVPLVQEALAAIRDAELADDEALGWLPLACRLAHAAWEFDTWSVLSARLVELARDTSALSVLPSALLLRLSNRVYAGDLAEAAALVAEATAIGEATGSGFFAHYGVLVLEPWRGGEAETRRVIDVITHDMLLRGEGKVLTATGWAAAVLHNSMGHHEEAYAAAGRGSAYPQELGLSIGSTVELVEAAARTGRPADAAAAAARIDLLARASGTDWALGTAAGVAAQVRDGREADELYREAVERLDRAGVRMEAARFRLLHGEWLRRAGRNLDAREQLGLAHELLSEIGAEAFAERARREYETTGATVRKPATRAPASLTPQEAQIARLAGEGLTNPEIGARLFISPRTVEWHLSTVFAKLGITSRRQLRTANRVS
ncbi:AAA family ATPase [Amycolatopsis sp. NPDC051128]|uniref:helix-turn-helix transcriptional regulator n=1 Tax=Amycolatopsis sp. NPDC051128 TaxID=3155412 RepID=UPI003413C872